MTTLTDSDSLATSQPLLSPVREHIRATIWASTGRPAHWGRPAARRHIGPIDNVLYSDFPPVCRCLGLNRCACKLALPPAGGRGCISQTESNVPDECIRGVVHTAETAHVSGHPVHSGCAVCTLTVHSVSARWRSGAGSAGWASTAVSGRSAVGRDGRC